MPITAAFCDVPCYLADTRRTSGSCWLKLQTEPIPRSWKHSITPKFGIYWRDYTATRLKIQ